jgi:hypothetical protein
VGVTLIRDPHPDFDGGGFERNWKVKQQKPYWDLLLDYYPGSSVFGWTLYPEAPGMKSLGAGVDGQGDVAKTAEQVCIVVTRQGAVIR